MKRRAPTLKQKLAATLLTIVRPDAEGVLRPVIPMHEAKGMTPQQIISRFEFDHVVFHVWGGPCDPWNLVPRPVAEHREKTKRDAGEIAKVRRGLKKRSGTKRKSRAIPGSRDSGWKKPMRGPAERRV